MSDPDLEQARRHHAALQAIFSRPRGAADKAKFEGVMRLCWGAWAALDDKHCRTRMQMLAGYAQDLLSPHANRTLDEEAVLNDKICRMLASYERWTNHVEAMRAAAKVVGGIATSMS